MGSEAVVTLKKLDVTEMPLVPLVGIRMVTTWFSMCPEGSGAERRAVVCRPKGIGKGHRIGAMVDAPDLGTTTESMGERVIDGVVMIAAENAMRDDAEWYAQWVQPGFYQNTIH